MNKESIGKIIEKIGILTLLITTPIWLPVVKISDWMEEKLK